MSVPAVALRDATFNQICRLMRDNHRAGDWSISTDGSSVWISCQKIGEPPTADIEVPRRIFNRLIAAYTKPRRPVRK
jgi:hypothetical protein